MSALVIYHQSNASGTVVEAIRSSSLNAEFGEFLIQRPPMDPEPSAMAHFPRMTFPIPTLVPQQMKGHLSITRAAHPRTTMRLLFLNRPARHKFAEATLLAP